MQKIKGKRPFNGRFFFAYLYVAKEWSEIISEMNS